MITIRSSLTPKPLTDQKPHAQPVPDGARSAVKTGAVVVLTPSALQLSRDLQAITTDPAKDPTERLDASVRLRQLAAKIFNET
jgi:hypothetical protein